MAANASSRSRTTPARCETSDPLDIWTRVEPGVRKPRFTRDEIAAVAIHIADAEGFAAVSMRRIATELDAGTMTLYHYIRTKDELLALVFDTLMAELVVPPGELPKQWRQAMTAIAHRSKSMLERHPWVLDIADDPALGPNSVRHFDQSLEAVSSLDAEIDDLLDVITVIDEYVFGYCIHQRTHFEPEGEGPPSHEVQQYVQDLAVSGDYPQLVRLLERHGSDRAWAMINEHARNTARFDRNLSRILDGFEVEFDRCRDSRPTP